MASADGVFDGSISQLTTRTNGEQVVILLNNEPICAFEHIEEAIQFFNEGLQLCYAARSDLDVNHVPPEWGSGHD